MSAREPADRKALWGWAFYDAANSPFGAVIVTFVFAAYFAKAVAVDEITGTGQWGMVMSLSGLMIAVLGPVLGALADAGGRRKPWIMGFTLVGASACMAMWLVLPDPSFALLALALVLIANTALEFGWIFYNAMLPDIARPETMGRWSGWAWGLGYAGGMIALVILLLFFIQADPPAFGLTSEDAQNVRIAGPIVGLWLILFSLPLFLLTPDLGRPNHPKGQGNRVRMALADLWAMLANLPKTPDLLRFLLGRMFYNDGLVTLFAFGGIYAAGTFGMSIEGILAFGILLNVTAGIGAAAFAPLDDRLGSKTVILVSLAGLIGFGITALLITDATSFIVAGALLGIFVGPVQAASRTLMARMAPPENRAAAFGLFALSGKVTAALGPFLFGVMTVAFESQRAGMAVIVVMFLLGAALIAWVREPAR